MTLEKTPSRSTGEASSSTMPRSCSPPASTSSWPPSATIRAAPSDRRVRRSRFRRLRAEDSRSRASLSRAPPSRRRLRRKPRHAPFQFGDVRLVPNLSKSFLSGRTLTAYLEAYGLAGDARLRVEFFLLKEGRLFSKVAPSLPPAGRGRRSVRPERDLAEELPPGDYVLRARITDETTGDVAERESPFSIRAR